MIIDKLNQYACLYFKYKKLANHCHSKNKQKNYTEKLKDIYDYLNL